MQTLEQFGQTIKAKYPQYSDIPDVELGQKMLAKYPQYGDMVTTEQPKQKQGFFKNVFDSLTTSERNLGQDIGRKILGGDKFVNNLAKQYTDNASKYLELARKGAKTPAGMKYTWEQMAQRELESAQQVGQDFKGRTPEQIVGDVLGVGLDVGLTLSGLSAAKATVGATGVAKGALQGAKAGATAGAIYGGAYGLAGGLQENKNVGGIIGQVAAGATGGALFGGALGAVTGGISGGIQQRIEKTAPVLKSSASQHSLTDIAGSIQNTNPDIANKIKNIKLDNNLTVYQLRDKINSSLTKEEQKIVAPQLNNRFQELIRSASMPEYRGAQYNEAFPNVKEQEKILKKAIPSVNELTPKQKVYYADRIIDGKLVLTPEENNFLFNHSDLFSGKNAVENFTNVLNRVAEEDASIGSYLANSGKTFNKNIFKQELLNSLSGVDDALVKKGTMDRYKVSLVDDFVKNIQGNKLSDLWQARKDFDKVLRNKLNAFSGVPTTKKALGNAIRTTAQDFIGRNLEDDVYKSAMSDMHQLINYSDNLLKRKFLKEVGKTNWQIFMKNHPNTAKLIKQTAGLLRLGGAFEVAQMLGL